MHGITRYEELLLKKRGGTRMKVTNYDMNGKLIPDLSKVIIPEDIQRSVISLILNGDQYITKNISKDEDKSKARDNHA